MPPKEERDDKKRLFQRRKEEILEIIEREFDLELLLKYRELRIIEHELERGKELKELLEKLILNEQIYADKASGRLSAPPQFNFTPSPSAGMFENGANPFVAEDEVFGVRTRASGLSRQAQNAPAAKPVQSAPQYQYDVRPDGTVLRMRCPACGAEKFRSMLGFLNHCRIHCKLMFANQDERLQKCGVPLAPEDIPAELQNLSNSLIQKSMELAQICVDVLPTKVVEDLMPEITAVEDENIKLADFGLSGQNDPVSSLMADIEPAATNRHFNSNTKHSVSRYYIKKEIVIGNVSRCLLDTGEVDNSIGGKAASHYFKLFIRDVNFKKRKSSDENDPVGQGILRHIKFARFFLHSAYKPNDVIDVYEHPFTIERPAWGEFPVRIQLHFFDERNKPVDLVHMLSIFSSVSPKYDQGVERLHEIEIDRNTDFTLSSAATDQPYPAEEVLDSDSGESDTEETINSNNEVSTVDQKSDEIDPESLKYCRYCGIPHMPQHSFDIIQKNCAHKPRKIRLNSRTLPSEIFSHCTVYNQEIQFEPKNAASSSDSQVDDDLFVNESSTDAVKMVAACVKILDLPQFLPTEAVSAVIASAMKCFLRNLLFKSIEQIPAPGNRAALDQKLPSVLTPLHVFQAVTADPLHAAANEIGKKRLGSANIFDFLTNAYFSASTSSSKPNQ